MYERLRRGLAKVFTDDGGSGTAFLVRDNLLITAAHVVGRCAGATISIGGTRYAATVLQTEITSDIALLGTTDLPNTLQPITIGTSSELQIGEDLLIAGFPLGSNMLTVHHGFLSAKGTANDFPAGSLTGLRTDCPLLQIDATVNEGFSGGPVFDASTNSVCGFVTSKYGLLRDFSDLRNELNELLRHPQTRQFASSGGGVILSGVDFGRLTAFLLQSLGIISRTMQFLHIGIGYAVAIEAAESLLSS